MAAEGNVDADCTLYPSDSLLLLLYFVEGFIGKAFLFRYQLVKCQVKIRYLGVI